MNTLLKLIKSSAKHPKLISVILGVVLVGVIVNCIPKERSRQQSATVTTTSRPAVVTSPDTLSFTNATIIAKSEHVNLRTQPDINSSVVNELHTGDKVVIVDKQNNESGELWFKVKVKHKVGWVYKDLISTGNTTPDSAINPTHVSAVNATPSVEQKFNDAPCDAFSPGQINGAVVYRFKIQSGGYRYLLMTDRQSVVNLFSPNFFTAKSEATDEVFDNNMTNAARSRFYDLITSYQYVANISEKTAKEASPGWFADHCV